MTKNKTKIQKLVDWAKAKRTRSFSMAMRELGYESDKAFRSLITTAQRKGLVKATFIGRKVQLRTF